MSYDTLCVCVCVGGGWLGVGGWGGREGMQGEIKVERIIMKKEKILAMGAPSYISFQGIM